MYCIEQRGNEHQTSKKEGGKSASCAQQQTPTHSRPNACKPLVGRQWPPWVLSIAGPDREGVAWRPRQWWGSAQRAKAGSNPPTSYTPMAQPSRPPVVPSSCSAQASDACPGSRRGRLSMSVYCTRGAWRATDREIY